jgi:TatD DNase family protein
MNYFDSHCHLQLKQFDADRDAVLARMQEREVGGIVIGVDYATSVAAVELAKAHDFLWAAIGLHPQDNVDEHFDVSKCQMLAEDPKVVAIGECGLDYSRGVTPLQKEFQKKRFEAQIELALTVKKSLIIHCRDAHDDMLAVLGDYMGTHPDLAVVIHFCTVSGEVAQKYIDLGCYLSFPGPVTYTDMYDDSIRFAPVDKILTETDSPFAAPVPFRGKRNEPVFVSHVAAKIALLKETDLEVVAKQVVANSRTVFGV